MRYSAAFSATLLLLLPVSILRLSAQTPATPVPATASDAAGPLSRYRDEPLIFEDLSTTVRMHADGTGDRLVHCRIHVQSEGAAQQFSVLTLTFASAYDTAVVDYVRVHKADGTVVETPVTDAMEMPAQVSREAPLYSDLKEKQIPVRSLSAGDTVEYAFRTTRTKAEAPGAFWGAEHFTAGGLVMLHESLTLEVPSGVYVQVWSPKHPATPTEHNGVRTWEWTSSQTKPSGRDKDGKMTAAGSDVHDPDEDADGRKLPSVAWTTFHSWAEVGDWYRGLALPRAQQTDGLKAKADELTRAAKTPEEQVRLLYQFVATQVRYVGIDLGIGRYQPHAAADVLANQYGDCKDKDTLLEALLRAKGFTTAPALIGAGLTPVADLPSPAVFNHVITTVDLAGSRIWLDTTPEGEPFRVLIPAIRDEQALVVPATGAARLERTPADPPFPFTEHFDAEATLDANGLLKGHMTMSVRSDNELGYRILLRRAAPAQWDDAMQYISGAMGFGGKVTNANLRQTDMAAPVRISWDYSRPEFGDWANHRILPLFPALEITTIDKEKAPEHDIDQGALRTLYAETRIKLPEGYRVDLPEKIHAQRSYATFDQTYRVENDALIVSRTVAILQKKVAKDQWKDYLAFTKAIGMESGENYIPLMLPQTSAQVVVKDGGKPTPTATPRSETAQMPEASTGNGDAKTAADLMNEARQAMTAGDWEAARAKLTAAEKVDAHAPYLLGLKGDLAGHDMKLDEAVTDMKAELAAHPDDNDDMITTLVRFLVYQKHDGEAITLLKGYRSRDSVALETLLASLQVKAKDYTGAVATLQELSAQHPDDPGVTTQLADALLHAKRPQEAAAAAKAVLDGSDDPTMLNSGSYILAETGLDLDLAERKARQAITTLEAASAARSLAEANSKAFAEANMLAAAWDTLGWVLFKEKRPAEAKPLLEAAWFNKPDVVVGSHLAQVEEALGKASDALTLNELAMVTEGAAQNEEELALVRANAERLRRTGAKSTAADTKMTLQAMRSFRVQKAAGVKGWGTFRVQLGDNGVVASDLVQGAATVKPMTAELNKLAIPRAVPPNSKARLLRDGVLSCTSERPQCEFVLMTHAGLGEEGVR